ncbi:MAG: phosphotransferase family protein [Panacagrimonas sp.]|nr:phosphotransferase family protein [Panacagrimonas sp.]MCC2658422.1 phosphotransferase family protein [Panacagrimonas sp.]
MNASAAPAFEDLAAAVRRRLGTATRLDRVEVPTLGGSNRTVIFDAVDADGARRRLVSRQETYHGPHSPFLAPSDQYRVMEQVHASGFPVPRPVFAYDEADGMGAGFVTEFVAGETLPKRIIESPAFADVRPRLARQFGELLARLHALPVADFAFLGSRADSLDVLEAQRRRIDAYGRPRPALELALRWLERERPDPHPPVLLHGDFRVGNLMVGPEGVDAVLDWECSHLGSAVEDIGWLGLRSWRFGRPDLPVGGISQWRPFLEAYEGAGGRRTHPEHIRWWNVFGLVRWTVLNLMQGYGHTCGTRRGLVFAACGRNADLIEYELLMTMAGRHA